MAELVRFERSIKEILDLRKQFESTGLEPTWSPIGFLGGWFSAGRTEAGLLLSTIVIGAHAIVVAADDRGQAAFIPSSLLSSGHSWRPGNSKVAQG